MGLDMYLRGEKYFWEDWEHPENNRKEDGLHVNSVILELGYWRKHPNLHGYIVQTFAEGKDECQRIELTADNIRQIIQAVKNGTLPETTGFFFGHSTGDEEEVAEDISTFEAALKWLGEPVEKPHLEPASAATGLDALAGIGMQAFEVKIPDKMPRESRSVYYQASW